MSEKIPHDCRVIGGSTPVIISQDTAISALRAMEKQAEAGAYKNLMADDASFVRASMRELERAANAK